MRTTLILNDELLRLVKMHAAETGTTVTHLVSESLRQYLGKKTAEKSTGSTFSMPTFGAAEDPEVSDFGVMSEPDELEVYLR